LATGCCNTVGCSLLRKFGAESVRLLSGHSILPIPRCFPLGEEVLGRNGDSDNRDGSPACQEKTQCMLVYPQAKGNSFAGWYRVASNQLFSGLSKLLGGDFFRRQCTFSNLTITLSNTNGRLGLTNVLNPVATQGGPSTPYIYRSENRYFSNLSSRKLHRYESVTWRVARPKPIHLLSRVAVDGQDVVPGSASIGSPAALRGFVRQVVRRVVVQAERMDVQTSRSELRAAITEDRAGGPCERQRNNRKRGRMT
jgi:hypothetical protein